METKGTASRRLGREVEGIDDVLLVDSRAKDCLVADGVHTASDTRGALEQLHLRLVGEQFFLAVNDLKAVIDVACSPPADLAPPCPV